MVNYQKDFEQGAQEAAILKAAAPETMNNFNELFKSAMKPQELDGKTKELIALGIAVAVRCEGCIRSHVKNCLKQGANLAELAEVVQVAILMGGGPATVYGGKTLAIAKELSNKSDV